MRRSRSSGAAPGRSSTRISSRSSRASSATRRRSQPPRGSPPGPAASEQQPHVDQVPQLPVVAPDVRYPTPFLDEAELPVEADRRGVLRKDAQRELVEPVRASPVDRGGDEGASHAAPTPPLRDHHPDLAEPETTLQDEKQPDDRVSFDRDEGAIPIPARCSPLNVDRRLGRDAVALLRHRGEEERQRMAITVLRESNLDGRPS